MPTSPRYGFDYLEVGEAVPSEAVNEALERIEAGGGHFIFKDRDLATPPGSPAAGDTYLVAASGTGDWATHDGEIAYRLNTAWIFIEPIEGFTAWVNDENALIGYDGSTWGVLASPSGSYLPLTGGTLSGDLVVPDEAYDATAWNASLEVPTKNAVRDKIEALAGTIPGAGASTTQPGEQISGFIAAPSNKSYTIAVKMAHGGTITETTTVSASGTCTATFKVNSTSLGGTANSVSSSEQSQAHASTNTFSAGDDIVLTVSSNSSCADMSFTIKYTRTLA